jgi:small conductance mechanosensitive channel
MINITLEQILLQIPTVEVSGLAKILETITTQLIGVGLKLVGAIAFWIVGNWLINFSLGLIAASFKGKMIDGTVVRYLISAIRVLLNIVLVVAILGFFGIETTSFAAILAAAGIAIGAAWAGLLSNFAAGAFLIILHPFKVGDFVSVGGVMGTVEEIGLFVTTIVTMDNIQTFVGNNKIFSDNIQNFSATDYRRVELVAQINHSVDHNDAIARLKANISQIPNVLSDPAPVVEILEFALTGTILAVRPFCHQNNYWQVYFDTNKMIRETFGSAEYPAPEQHFIVNSSK